MKIKLTSLLLLTLTLLCAPAGAAGICRTDTDTLLRVHASRTFVYRSIRLPPPPMHVEEEYLVTRGGFSLVIRTETELCCDQKVSRTVADGPAKLARVASLTTTLTSHQIGQQTSCVVENDLSGPGGVRVVGNYEVSWYAPDGSENSFQVVFADPGESSLPACGLEAGTFIDAIRTYADAFAALPGREVCKP